MHCPISSRILCVFFVFMLFLGSVAAETGSFLVSLGQGGFVYCCNEENLTFSIQIPPAFTPASEGSFTFDDGVLQIIVLPASQVSDNMPNTEQQMLADFVSYEKNYLQTELKLSLSDDGQKPIAIASNTFFLWQYLIESKINSPYPVFRNFVTFKNGYILNLVFQTKAKLDSNGILAHEEKVLNTLHFLSQPVSPEQMAQAIAKAKPDNVDISPNDGEIDTSSDIPFSKAPQAVQALEKKHTGLCPFCKANQIPVCVFEEDPRYDVCCSSCRKILETIEIKAAPTPPPSSKEIEKAVTSLKHKWKKYQEAISTKDFGMLSGFMHPDIIQLSGGESAFLKLLKEANEALEAMGIFISKCKIGEPFAPERIGNIWVARGALECPVFIEGMRGHMRSFSLAVSEDGLRWHFIDSNQAGRDFFQEKYGCSEFIKNIPNPRIEFAGTKQFWLNENNVWNRYNLSPEEEKSIPKIITGFMVQQHKNDFLTGVSNLPAFNYLFEAAVMEKDDLLGFIPSEQHFLLLTTNTRFTNRGQFQIKAKWLTKIQMELSSEAGGFTQDIDIFLEVP